MWVDASTVSLPQLPPGENKQSLRIGLRPVTPPPDNLPSIRALVSMLTLPNAEFAAVGVAVCAATQDAGKLWMAASKVTAVGFSLASCRGTDSLQGNPVRLPAAWRASSAQALDKLPRTHDV